MRILASLLVLTLASPALALDLHILGANGLPLARAMVTATPQQPGPVDRSDNGYAQPRTLQHADRWQTRFSDIDGRVHVPLPTGKYAVRLRLPGMQEVALTNVAEGETRELAMRDEADVHARAAAKPANVWAAAVHVGTPAQDKNFAMQCGFCHQQGAPFVRAEHSPEQWRLTIARMVGYGSRLASAVRDVAPQKLHDAYADLRAHPEKLGEPLAWQDSLAQTRMDEWPLGDAMSQMHDMLVHSNGFVYLGDNIQDRLYELEPCTGQYTVYKLPRERDDQLGGLFAARLAQFPKHDSYLALHSLAVSGKDGHIFLTPSVQRRIVEFDPKTKQFTVHHLADGLYPHTIRVDAQDRVWFTLALSNQIGMIDRATGQQHFIDLPTRSLGEAFTVRILPLMFKLAELGLPLAALPVDARASGTPLPYGIDMTPDGVVWAARLHANDLVRVDPQTLQATLIDVPATGPRRLRSDAEGNLWITAFADSAILRYQPNTKQFQRFDMPTLPKGSDTPYALNVDKQRGIVWVTGTASDTLCALTIATGKWSVFPLPHRMTFTRDIEIADDGSIFTANGAFPAWQIEGAQPTLIHVSPPWTTPARHNGAAKALPCP
jgi:virginiamycin B lyase